MFRDVARLSWRLTGVADESVRHSWFVRGDTILQILSRTQKVSEIGQRTSVSGVWRSLYSTIDSEQHEIDDINAAFVLAREEIEYAQEDAESTYFNESYQTAKSAVDKVLGDFNSVLQRLDPPEREKLQRSMGLKMEQLKAELEQLDRLHT